MEADGQLGRAELAAALRGAAATASLGLTLCLLAALLGVPALLVPGVALTLLVLAAAGWALGAGRRGLIVRSLATDSVQEDTELELTVSVHARGLPLPTGELSAWPGGPVTRARGRVGGTRAATARRHPDSLGVAVSFSRRGLHELGPASFSLADPLGLCRLELRSAPHAVLVLPRIEPLSVARVGGLLTGPQDRASSAAEALATEVDTLRPHREGAPASRIHWPAVARTGTLLERRLVAEADHCPLLVVDPRAPASTEALDAAVRAAASLCVHLARLGGCGLLLPGDRRATLLSPDLLDWPACHARLALLEPDAGAPLPSRPARLGTVIWVCAGSRPTQAPAQLRARTLYVVTPHPLPGRPVAFTVAGCSGQRLRRAGNQRRAAA